MPPSRETLSRALGALECVAGVALLYQGCRAAWLAEDGLSNVAGTFMVVSAVFAFIVPGSLLWLRSPLRWLAQLPVAVMLAWLGFDALTRAAGLR